MTGGRRLALAAGTGALTALVAAVCRAPSVVFADSGELLTAVVTKGVAHPPGFPLYLAAAGGFLSLATAAGADAARALNLFSALSNGVATALMVGAALALFDRTGAPASEGTRRLLAVAAGLLAGFGPTLFDFSLSIEVYAFHAIFLAGALAAALAAGGEQEPGRRRLLTLAAGLFVGGGLAVHHATMAVVLPGLFLFLHLPGEGTERWKRAALFVGGAVPGLATYLVLPLRAAVAPPLNWGNPSNFFRFWVHISARDYQVNIDSSAEQIAAHALRFVEAWAGEFSSAGLALALAGLALLLVRRRLLAWAFLALLLGDVAFAVRYEIAEDQAAYYLPVFMATSLLAVAGIAAAAGLLERRGTAARRTVLAAGVLLVGLVVSRNVVARAGRRLDGRASEAAANLLACAPAGALVFTPEWNLYAPVLAAQEVDGQRDDLLVLDVLLLRRGWYLDALLRRHPDRVAGAKEAFEAYRAKLADWEEGRPFVAEDLTRLYDGFTKKLTEVTWARGRETVWVGTLMGQHLPAGAALVPAGIGYRVLPVSAATAVYVPDAPVTFEASLRSGLPLDSVFEEKVRPLLAGMRVQRALYEEAFGRAGSARRILAEARRLSPADASSLEVEGDFLLNDGKPAEAVDRFAADVRSGGDAARLAEKSRAALEAARKGP